jgi:hypothetical protein
MGAQKGNFMSIKKTKDSDKGEPGDRQIRRKSGKTAQPGRLADKRVVKGIDRERRIIAEECEEELEGLKALDRMTDDPSRQTVIHYLREAAIDSNHAERIVASIIMLGRDRTFLARGISSPQGRFSEEASSASDQAPDDQSDA